MRRLFLILILILSTVAAAQTTPNLNFNVPVPGTLNWGNGINQNFFTLDSLLSGGTVLNNLSLSTSIMNGVYNPTTCNSTSPPSWCSGIEIGAWTNAAIAALPGHCGTIFIPTGTYVQSIPIVKPRCIRLVGAGPLSTVLNWTSNTGQSIIIADSQGATSYPVGSVEDIGLVGPGAASSAVAIYIGGSDGSANAPPTSTDPGTNYGDNTHTNRLKISNFGTAFQWGNNSWGNVNFESVITNNGTGTLFPNSITSASGERIVFIGGAIQNNSVVGSSFPSGGTQVDVDFYFIAMSFDFNTGWAIQNLNTSYSVFVFGSHIEQPAQWIQSAGILQVNGTYMTNGGSSGTLGYLIDITGAPCGITNSQAFNGGTGKILNPAHSLCQLQNVGWSGPGIGLPIGYTGNPANTLVTATPVFGNVLSDLGTVCSASNVALGAGWGTSAASGTFSGYSQTCEFTITSGSASFAAAPTVSFTFPNGFNLSPAGNPPVCTLDVHQITGAGGAILFGNTTKSNTTPVFTATTSTGAAFTPAASETYTVDLRCGP